MANSVDQDQAAPIGAVCSGSTLFASILDSQVILVVGEPRPKKCQPLHPNGIQLNFVWLQR